jgi:hypothetical protein
MKRVPETIFEFSRGAQVGQEWTFDNFVRIVDNPKMSARLRPQPVFFYPSVLEPPFRLDLLL